MNWDAIPATIGGLITRTSAGAGYTIESTWVVPTGKRWLVLGFGFSLDETANATVVIADDVGGATVIENVMSLFAATAGVTYSTRGITTNATARYPWTPIELPAGKYILFIWNASAANKHLYSGLIYKEAPA